MKSSLRDQGILISLKDREWISGVFLLFFFLEARGNDSPGSRLGDWSGKELKSIKQKKSRTESLVCDH